MCFPWTSVCHTLSSLPHSPTRSRLHRWFHTGDIGVYTPDGSMMLVDRLKNLIKLKGGEYIALESMEASYSTSPYCAALNGGVMVYGDGEMDRPVALFQVHPHS